MKDKNKIALEKLMESLWEEKGYRVEYEYRTIKTCGADITFKIPKRIKKESK